MVEVSLFPVLQVIYVAVINDGMQITPSTLTTVEEATKLFPVMVNVVPPLDGPYNGKTV